MISKKTFAVVSMVAAVLVAACGSNGASDSGGGHGGAGAGHSGSGASTSQGKYTCCINDAHYRCPDKASFDACSGFDIDACMQACAPGDFQCPDDCFQQWTSSDNDPSGCTEDATVQCGGSGGSSGGSCVGDWDGAMCDEDFNCDSSNCVNNKCYGTSPGNPCEEDFNCASSNCYQGCCYGTAAGDSCEEDFNCASSNCFDNVCQ